MYTPVSLYIYVYYVYTYWHRPDISAFPHKTQFFYSIAVKEGKVFREVFIPESEPFFSFL